MYLGKWRDSAPPTLVKSTTYANSTRQGRVCVPRNCQSQVRLWPNVSSRIRSPSAFREMVLVRPPLVSVMTRPALS